MKFWTGAVVLAGIAVGDVTDQGDSDTLPAAVEIARNVETVNRAESEHPTPVERSYRAKHCLAQASAVECLI